MDNKENSTETSHVTRTFRLTKDEFETLNAIKEGIRKQMGLRLSINATVGYVISQHGLKAETHGG